VGLHLKNFIHLIAKTPFLCYKIKKRQRFFETRNLIRKAKKDKTFEAGMIRDQGAKALWTKRGSKKKEARKE
jgi:hypothetical protein